MGKNIIKIFLILTIAFIASGCQTQADLPINNDTTFPTTNIEKIEEQPVLPQEKPENIETQPITEKIIEPEEKIEIKTTLDLPVSFASQAPFADWSMPYQEACEEASIIMTAKYFKNELLDKDVMNREILALVEWEKEYFGYWEDTTAEEVVEVLEKYYAVKSHTSTDVSIDNIKEELNKGNLIILPTAGRLLDNPYFSGEGPVYHMLVVRGYDRNEFITNDPGTRRGDGFKYKYDNLINAVHNWNKTKENIYTGQKIMVVVGE